MAKYELVLPEVGEDPDDFFDLVSDIMEIYHQDYDFVGKIEDKFEEEFKKLSDKKVPKNEAQIRSVEASLNWAKDQISEEDLEEYSMSGNFNKFLINYPDAKKFIKRTEEKKPVEYDVCDRYDFGPWTRS